MTTTQEAIDHKAIDHDAPFDKPLRAALSDITYDEAMIALQGAIAKAQQLDISVCLAVTDTHGSLVAFARMDGARHMTQNIAVGRAKIAGYWGLPAKNMSALAQRIAITDIDDFTNMGPSQGGIPLYRDGEIIGGIGCSGGHGEGGLGLPDDEVARAGAKALDDRLGAR
jgi:uncharacterized protein GlcG (DUF336 family)